jgi:hypothetical protein
MLIVMFFLHSLYSCYDAFLEQFCSCYKSLEGASLDLIVADIRYHDEFKLVGSDHNPLLVKTPKAAAAAASSQGDKQGKWNNPYEWLASFNIKVIKKRWMRSLAGTGFCPICHQVGDKLSPVNCPLLAKLNLKLVKGPPLAAAPAPAPPGHVTVASPSPGGRSTVADRALASGSSGSGDVPLVLVTTVADEEYDLGENFHWEGNEYGVGFTGLSAIECNYNNNVALYPSCLQAVVEATPHFSVSQDSPLMCPESCAPSPPFVSLLRCLVLSRTLSSIIARMSAASILPGSSCRFTVANSGATDHMLPDKSTFISYNLVTNLQARMGNNSYLPVLGQGSAIISLNGQCILVRNALHVLGLVVPLYSLRPHFTQHGCRFIGASGVGILVWFPTFVLLVDTSKDCHLTYKSSGWSASLELLHYVQPRCSPSLYPLELPSTSVAKQTRMDQVVIEDDSSDELIWCYPQPKCTPRPPLTSMADSISQAPPPVDLSTVLDQLQLLAKAISSLKSQVDSPPSHLSRKLS